MYIINSTWIIAFLRFYLAKLDDPNEDPHKDWNDGEQTAEEKTVERVMSHRHMDTEDTNDAGAASKPEPLEVASRDPEAAKV